MTVSSALLIYCPAWSSPPPTLLPRYTPLHPYVCLPPSLHKLPASTLLHQPAFTLPIRSTTLQPYTCRLASLHTLHVCTHLHLPTSLPLYATRLCILKLPAYLPMLHAPTPSTCLHAISGYMPLPLQLPVSLLLPYTCLTCYTLPYAIQPIYLCTATSLSPCYILHDSIFASPTYTLGPVRLPLHPTRLYTLHSAACSPYPHPYTCLSTCLLPHATRL